MSLAVFIINQPISIMYYQSHRSITWSSSSFRVPIIRWCEAASWAWRGMLQLFLSRLLLAMSGKKKER